MHTHHTSQGITLLPPFASLYHEKVPIHFITLLVCVGFSYWFRLFLISLCYLQADVNKTSRVYDFFVEQQWIRSGDVPAPAAFGADAAAAAPSDGAHGADVSVSMVC